ncbi:hypothetical protein OIU85_009866 [Salix viminalis]|uniref:Uncharacterized protein n=1 Tax=Salix viminalis TaxID=40686 RepID=A0A9Q0NVM1_SALVM|nr:hypothetical protein OIU85_009866 [Salix viminalis]
MNSYSRRDKCKTLVSSAPAEQPIEKQPIVIVLARTVNLVVSNSSVGMTFQRAQKMREWSAKQFLRVPWLRIENRQTTKTCLGVVGLHLLECMAVVVVVLTCYTGERLE